MTRRLALVTGASAGLGAAFARRLAATGHDVALLARRRDRLEALATEIRSQHGVGIIVIEADLARADAIDRAAAAVKDSGRAGVDILINNAGYSLKQRFLATDWQAQAEFIATLATAPAAFCHRLAPFMVAQKWGRIINVASVVAFSNGAAGHTLYPAVKSFVLKMSRSLAAELGPSGVKVSALCPGSTATEFQAANGLAITGAKPPPGPVQTAEDVVAEALARNERGHEVIVTGLGNKIGVGVLRYAPEFLTTPLIRKMVEKQNE